MQLGVVKRENQDVYVQLALEPTISLGGEKAMDDACRNHGPVISFEKCKANKSTT